MAFFPKLHATNHDFNADSVDIDTLLLEATDVITWELDAEGLYASVQNGEPVSYGGKVYSSNDVEVKFQVKTMPIAFPTIAVSIWDYFEIAFFKKDFHYLEFGDYTIYSDADSSLICPRVAVQLSQVEHLNESAAKRFTLDVTLGAKL